MISLSGNGEVNGYDPEIPSFATARNSILLKCTRLSLNCRRERDLENSKKQHSTLFIFGHIRHEDDVSLPIRHLNV